MNKELSEGDYRAINEMCNAWLECILFIAGGISNIPNNEKQRIYKLQSTCIREYTKYLEQNNINFLENDILFWKKWKKLYPDFYNLDYFIQFNPDRSKAELAYLNAQKILNSIYKNTNIENRNIEIIKGDITDINVDIIVNAANKSLLGGEGVDGLIHKKSGKELLDECMKLNGCNTGEAKITGAYNLTAKYIIHTVSPIWSLDNDYEESKNLLKQCYRNSYELAIKNNAKTIAFPCIGMGVYQVPIDVGTKISIDTAIQYSHYFEKIYLVCYEEDIYQAYCEYFKSL